MLGLSENEAQIALKTWGYNELPSAKDKSVLDIAKAVIREPMFLLLMGCGGLYMILGDYKEGIVLSLAIFLIIGITFFQYKKTTRALELLKKIASPGVFVIRNDREVRIAAREIVPGDLLVLKEGDRVAADATLIESAALFVDESLLTGESFAIKKSVDKSPQVFLGTLVLAGRGVARVDKTGPRTQLGQIGASLALVENRDTRLQKEMRGVIRLFFIASILICVLVVVLFYLKSGRLIESVLTGLSSSMAILPEEFPVVLSVFLAIGSWRLTKNNVLTRYAATIESLGAATVLCTDKTGTLTQNRMQVAALYNGRDLLYRADFIKRFSSFDELVLTAWGASAIKPTDPMELAIGTMQKDWGADTTGFVDLVKEYPLSEGLLVMTQVWQNRSENNHFVAAKGAPEAILKLCSLSNKEINHHLAVTSQLASQGYRVLGVAKAAAIAGQLPTAQNAFLFQFLGLVAFEDPIRSEVPGAIQECVTAGIKIIMITGDHPETAMSIAKQIGLNKPNHVITGDELEKLSPENRSAALISCSVFARIRPQQKLLLVESLQEVGEVVAMTGDGVNDAPALKKADIGIAMGLRGTDVAREAAGLVLLDDNFTSIVAAVRSGRRIYDNLQKAMSYIVAIHIPIIGLVLIPALSSFFPLLLLPVHIVFMELVIDPVCSIAFESAVEEKNVMRRPPRSINQRFFVWKNFWSSCVSGAGVLLMVVGVYLHEIKSLHTPDQARAVAFSSLFIGNLLLIFSSLSRSSVFEVLLKRKNPAAFIIVGAALLFLALSVFYPPLRSLFHFENPGIKHFIPVVWAGLGMLVFLESLKLIKKRG